MKVPSAILMATAIMSASASHGQPMLIDPPRRKQEKNKLRLTELEVLMMSQMSPKQKKQFLRSKR